MIAHPCAIMDASFGRLCLPKHRCCVEPPPSVAVLKLDVRVLSKNVLPCTFLDDEFAARQTRY